MKQFVKTTRTALVVQKSVDIALVDISVINFLGLVPLGVMLVITMIAVKQVHIGKDIRANFPPYTTCVSRKYKSVITILFYHYFRIKMQSV